MQHNLPKYPGERPICSDRFLYPEMLKMSRKLPNNLQGQAFYKIAKFV